MSFASTPLGQGRRLDHHTFLKGASNPAQIHGAANRQRSHPHRQSTHNPPASYAYGAPTQSTQSPPKPARSEATATAEPQEHASDSEQPALVRFARLKQREQAQQLDPANPLASAARVVGSRVVNTPPDPDRWSVKDTSVNIASAFHRAANSTVIPAHDSSASSNSSLSFNQTAFHMNPNDSWASGTQRKQTLPRSTSVEYEKETQVTVNRRLGVPPTRAPLARQPRPPAREPSHREVPGSQPDEEPILVGQRERGKSPFEHIAETTRRLVPATFLMRRLSQEPESRPAPGQNVQDKSSSYDYSAEEREFQDLSQREQAQRRANAAHKRNRMSMDNKAYKPSQSDFEESDEEFEEDGKRRRRKKKAGAAGGPLTSLPVTSYDKRKKKRKGTRGNGMENGDEESSEEEGQSHEQIAEERSRRGASVLRTSVPPPSQRSVPPEVGHESVGLNSSIIDARDVEAGLQPGLHSIAEADEIEEDDSLPLEESVEALSHRTFSVGALLGRAVHAVFSLVSLVMSSIWSAFSYLPFLCGRLLGHLVELVVLKPVRWIAAIDTTPLMQLGKFATIALTVYIAWYALNSGILDMLPSRQTWPPPYHPPADIPPADISALSTRLVRLESALSSLSLDVIRLHEDARNHGSQLGSLETQMRRESNRVQDAESKYSTAVQGLQEVQHEVRVLNAQLEAHKQQQGRDRNDRATDDEARALLRALEERVGTVEGGVKEALELGKHASSSTPAGNVLDWWNKLASGKTSGLTIKSSDGKDVTGLINQLVDSAISKASKDTLARPDFAMYSGGASIIPSLTSETYEMKPQGLTANLLGLVTGNGYAVGRPPVTALHHETHNGHCWPFPGTQGQLGVMLSSPVRISDVTIDHVPREVATDMRSAPRHMELWGLVEGDMNLEVYQAWQNEREAQRAAAELAGEAYVEPADDYPKTLPRSVPYMRIANFTYNIYAPEHVQTFAVPQEIQDLRMDFGVVALVVKSNWGREEFTCLYRFRVHGERIGEIPPPLPEDAALSP